MPGVKKVSALLAMLLYAEFMKWHLYLKKILSCNSSLLHSAVAVHLRESEVFLLV